MRLLSSLVVCSAVLAFALAPAESEAGPFRYRGPHDLWPHASYQAVPYYGGYQYGPATTYYNYGPSYSSPYYNPYPSYPPSVGYHYGPGYGYQGHHIPHHHHHGHH